MPVLQQWTSIWCWAAVPISSKQSKYQKITNSSSLESFWLAISQALLNGWPFHCPCSCRLSTWKTQAVLATFGFSCVFNASIAFWMWFSTTEYELDMLMLRYCTSYTSGIKSLWIFVWGEIMFDVGLHFRWEAPFKKGCKVSFLSNILLLLV